ncbi:MAG: cytochrome c-type biogenesis protein CcmH [Solirubrobacteraceae bacterium]|nr:cytochrome c-type biogenesis protein CcmH [Solirubrobacteraceae bacterium]
MIRRLLVLVAALALALAAAPAASLAAPASLPDVEDEVMCPTCKMPLNTAQSPQANEQREFIRGLIAQGKTKQQVKDALVAEYGKDVLADPPDEGFGITAYLVPVLCILLLIAGLAVLVPRWKRGGDDDTERAVSDGGDPVELSAAEAARLDEDLARYDA